MQSGDKPAAVHFVFLTKPELCLRAIENIKQSLKSSETHAICGLDDLVGQCTQPIYTTNHGLVPVDSAWDTGRTGINQIARLQVE